MAVIYVMSIWFSFPPSQPPTLMYVPSWSAYVVSPWLDVWYAVMFLCYLQCYLQHTSMLGCKSIEVIYKNTGKCSLQIQSSSAVYIWSSDDKKILLWFCMCSWIYRLYQIFGYFNKRFPQLIQFIEGLLYLCLPWFTSGTNSQQHERKHT